MHLPLKQAIRGTCLVVQCLSALPMKVKGSISLSSLGQGTKIPDGARPPKTQNQTNSLVTYCPNPHTLERIVPSAFCTIYLQSPLQALHLWPVNRLDQVLISLTRAIGITVIQAILLLRVLPFIQCVMFPNLSRMLSCVLTLISCSHNHSV